MKRKLVSLLKRLTGALVIFLLVQICHVIFQYSTTWPGSISLSFNDKTYSSLLRDPPMQIPDVSQKSQTTMPNKGGKTYSYGECGKLETPVFLDSSQDAWTSLRENFFVYSAFYDHRNKNKPAQVKIMAVISKVGAPTQFYCYLWRKRNYSVVPASVFRLPESRSYRYKALFLVCDVPFQEVPDFVTVSLDRCQLGAQVHLKVHAPAPELSYNFTVCTGGPLKLNYSNIYQLVEWIEINSLFGGERFVLYDHNSSENLKPYIRHFVQEGKLDMYPWALPLNQKDIKNFGHIVLIHDCLYRYMYKTKYLVYLDLDEILVPKKGKTWLEVLQDARCQSASQSIFQNVFFKMEWDDDELFADNETVKSINLSTILKTKREHKIWPHKSRSKYIVRPEMINVVGVHFVHNRVPWATGTCEIPYQAAWLQHYRNWNDPHSSWIVDREIHRFSDDIIQRASVVHQKVKSEKPI